MLKEIVRDVAVIEVDDRGKTIIFSGQNNIIIIPINHLNLLKLQDLEHWFLSNNDFIISADALNLMSVVLWPVLSNGTAIDGPLQKLNSLIKPKVSIVISPEDFEMKNSTIDINYLKNTLEYLNISDNTLISVLKSNIPGLIELLLVAIKSKFTCISWEVSVFFINLYLEIKNNENEDYKKLSQLLLKILELIGYELFPIYQQFNNRFNEYLSNSLVTSIIGPCIYSEYELQIPGFPIKKIGIFGERHNTPNQRKTQNFSFGVQRTATFIRKLVSNNPGKTYDLYVEFPILISGSSDTNILIKNTLSYTMDSLAIEFSSCFELLKTNCAFKNLRGHYIDFRLKYTFNLENNTKSIENYINAFIEDKKIKRIDINPILKKKIDTFFEYKFLFFISNSTNNNYELENLNALFMDYYALTRLFKTPKTLNDFQENVIIYAGSDHAKTYLEFMNEPANGFNKILEKNWYNDDNLFPASLDESIITFLPQEKEKSFIFN